MTEIHPDIANGTDIAVSARAIRWQRRRTATRDALRRLRRDRPALVAIVVLVVVAVLALLAPFISTHSDLEAVNTAANPVWATPGSHFVLGTDNLGRSVALQVLWGARVSLFVGLMATLLTVALGTLIGIVAGFFRGWLDALLMRFTDWFMVIPFLPTAIVLATVLGRSLWIIVFVIGITSWPSTARLVRSQVLSIRERLYVDRARALGASRTHIIGRHVLPNVAPLVLASSTLAVPISILTETTLSFLGLGDPTQVSWGGMLEQARDVAAVTTNRWWYYLPPGVGIILVVLAFTILGRSLESVLDPRLRER